MEAHANSMDVLMNGSFATDPTQALHLFPSTLAAKVAFQ
jgi:hypothetical protein